MRVCITETPSGWLVESLDGRRFTTACTHMIALMAVESMAVIPSDRWDGTPDTMPAGWLNAVPYIDELPDEYGRLFESPFERGVLEGALAHHEPKIES